MLQGKIQSTASVAGRVSSTTHPQRNEGNITDVTCSMRILSPLRFICRPSPSKQKLQRGKGSTPPSPQPEPSRRPSPTKLVLSRMSPPNLIRMSPPKFRRPSPLKLRKLTFAMPSTFSQTKPPTPLVSSVPVQGAYGNLNDTDGKDAASLDPSALFSSRTTSTGMNNPVSNKVPQRRNTKAEAKERQHPQDLRKGHNNRSRANITLKDQIRNNRQGGIKGCLTAAMASKGERGHNDVIFVHVDDDGNSDSKRGSNDTNVVDSKKYLSFIITRDEDRGA